MNCQRFDISYTLCPIYIASSLMGHSKQTRNGPPSGSLGRSVAEQSSVQLHGSEFEFCSRLFLFQFSLQLL